MKKPNKKSTKIIKTPVFAGKPSRQRQLGTKLQPTPNSEVKMTGAQILLNTLVKLEVDTIFGYPGGAIMPIYDALYDYGDKLRHVLTRHEQGAVHAAQGYARVANRPGICFATSGPGATNLVTGIADAAADSVPLLCITGQVASTLLGTDAFQEADVMGITTPITKWNYQVTKPQEIEEVIVKAYHIAHTGRPGPVLVDITKDAQVGYATYKNITHVSIPSYNPNTKPNAKQIELAAGLINKSKCPLVLSGHGVLIADACRELMQLVERADLPVAVTMHGLSTIATTHKNYVGWLGMHGNYAPNVLTQEADVIVALGMRFDDRVTGRLADYAPNAKVIHIDIDPSELNKNVVAAIPITADVKLALIEMLKHIKPTKRTSWLGKFKKLYDIEHSKVIEADLNPQKRGLTMAQVVDEISRQTKGLAIVVPDVGQHQMKVCRYYNFALPNSLITSGGMGTMGFALPAALGATVATRRQVIAVIGDGCFQMTIQELGTIVQENLDVKIVILNNNFLGMVRQWQEMFFEKRYSFVHMQNPDFIKIAEGYGICASRVTEREGLMRGVKEMLAKKGPYLLEVMCQKEENVFPMIPTNSAVHEIRLE